MLLSQGVHLVVNKPASEFSEIEAYLVNTLVVEWRRSYDQITNESFRGDVRLETFLNDYELTREIMHETLINQEPWGLVHAWAEN